MGIKAVEHFIRWITVPFHWRLAPPRAWASDIEFKIKLTINKKMIRKNNELSASTSVRVCQNAI